MTARITLATGGVSLLAISYFCSRCSPVSFIKGH